MSEVTTLKQLMLDAARYRWLRENMDQIDWLELYDCNEAGPYILPPTVDSYIDAELDRE